MVKEIKSTAVESVIVGDNNRNALQSNIQSNSKSSSLSSHQLQSQMILTSNMGKEPKISIKSMNSN